MVINLKNNINKELESYNWISDYKIFDRHPFYDIIFPRCKIVLYLNEKYNSVECYINNPLCTSESLFNKRYQLPRVLEANNEDISNLYWTYSNVEKEEYIKQYLKLLHLKLLNVVNGDFKWEKRAEEIKKDAMKIANVMDDDYSSDIGRKIYKKMVTMDNTWKDDLKNYSKEKHS